MVMWPILFFSVLRGRQQHGTAQRDLQKNITNMETGGFNQSTSEVINMLFNWVGGNEHQFPSTVYWELNTMVQSTQAVLD